MFVEQVQSETVRLEIVRPNNSTQLRVITIWADNRAILYKGMNENNLLQACNGDGELYKIRA